MTRPDHSRSTESSVESLKELVTIISGLAATNSVLQFMNGIHNRNGYTFSNARLIPTLLFAVVIIMIVRFYQGNIRHLDEEYAGRTGKAYSAPSLLPLSVRVASDFTVILAEALILSGLSFLQSSTEQFAVLLTVLLALDALWFFFVHFFTSKTVLPLSVKLQGRALLWMTNNGICALAEGILAGLQVSASGNSVYGLAVSLVALTNVALDLVLLFGFYFPGKTVGRRVFLAAPFSGRTKDVNYRLMVDGTRKTLELAKYVVFSAHRDEEWGVNLWGPAEALARDLDEVHDADLLVALVDETISGGVQLEIGAALDAGVVVVQVCAAHNLERIPYLNRGFTRLGRAAHTVTYDTPAECPSVVLKAVERYMGSE